MSRLHAAVVRSTRSNDDDDNVTVAPQVTTHVS